MKAMFCFSNTMPSTIATTPSDQRGDPRDAQLRRGVRLALLEHGGVQVVRHRRGAGQGQARHHRQDGRERHRRDEAEEDVAADRLGQVHRRHVVAAEQGAGRILEGRVGADQHDRAEADDEGQDVEVADPSRSPTAPTCALPWRRAR